MAALRRELRLNLEDVSSGLEEILKALDDMTMAEKVDVGARMRGVCKNAEKIDTAIKDAIKTHRRHKKGTVLGDVFKAVLTLVPVSRLDQKALKEAKPGIHAAYCKDCEDERVTFEAR